MKRITLLFSFVCLAIYGNAQIISAGGVHSLVVCDNGTVQAWGRNYFGQLGNGGNNDTNSAVSVTSLVDIIAVSGGDNHSIFLRNDGTVWACGYNGNSGTLGNGTNINSSSIPLQVSILTGVTSISAGWYHSLALRNDSTVWAWGGNMSGELGNGISSSGSNIPVQVNNLSDVIAVAGGMGHSLALKSDGTVWSWGDNSHGQLGNGNISYNNALPIQVIGLTNIIAISAGANHSIALENDGTVWTWGYNAYGQLGNDTNISSNIPIHIASLTGVITIEAGYVYSLALKNDGTVWTWGMHGGCLLSDDYHRWIPTQMNSLSGITTISGGGDHNLILKNDGSVWVWGCNYYGEFGNGVTGGYTDTPVQATGGVCTVLTAISESIAITEVSIFPNPSSGIFKVQMGNSQAGAKVTVRDVLGTCLLEKDFRGETSQEINLCCQPKGIYFVELLSGEERVVRKVVVQ
jgi:alpha-tubulin suppressor-like RCC1 family protein